ncbi:hypothetical protein G7Y89_g14821 [Cudoniella acicularis]|uniref:Uncharacterized protein n=1 Tax=Cudoniella acicularis TaxID=354080 RepID=A0A8H4QZB1_9HELO|nr:hypothetical protein G7Y89_g14821 [Cudoniella acicularis]
MFCTELIKLAAGLKNLRHAPGDMGELKSVIVNNERKYLSENWSEMTMDATRKFPLYSVSLLYGGEKADSSDFTAWKLHYEGKGKGVYEDGETCSPTQRDLDVAMFNLRKMIAKAQTAAVAAAAAAAAPPPTVA